MKRQTQWLINQRNHVAKSQIFWLTLYHRCAQRGHIQATVSRSTASVSEVLRRLALMLRNRVSLCLAACTSTALSLATVLCLTLSTGPRPAKAVQKALLGMQLHYTETQSFWSLKWIHNKPLLNLPVLKLWMRGDWYYRFVNIIL